MSRLYRPGSVAYVSKSGGMLGPQCQGYPNSWHFIAMSSLGTGTVMSQVQWAEQHRCPQLRWCLRRCGNWPWPQSLQIPSDAFRSYHYRTSAVLHGKVVTATLAAASWTTSCDTRRLQTETQFRLMLLFAIWTALQYGYSKADDTSTILDAAPMVLNSFELFWTPRATRDLARSMWCSGRPQGKDAALAGWSWWPGRVRPHWGPRFQIRKKSHCTCIVFFRLCVLAASIVRGFTLKILWIWISENFYHFWTGTWLTWSQNAHALCSPPGQEEGPHHKASDCLVRRYLRILLHHRGEMA